jgi:hypothetical protein
MDYEFDPFVSIMGIVPSFVQTHQVIQTLLRGEAHIRIVIALASFCLSPLSFCTHFVVPNPGYTFSPSPLQ